MIAHPPTRGKKLKPDQTWSYSDKSVYNTSYLTHNFYTYPAKFIPQIAARLISENSKEGDIVVDPFMGSGTTIVEALLHKRIGVGCDINFVAYLVAKAKTTPIKNELLEKEIKRIQSDLEYRMNGKYNYYLSRASRLISKHERIDYWFKESQKNKLAIIYSRICETRNTDIRNLFLVAFAQILKGCSIWLQSSVKPQRDFNKTDRDPTALFLSKVKRMAKRNKELLERTGNITPKNINDVRKVSHGDARKIPCEDNTASLIVTSPPYVTSYEYADLHQLPALWLKKMTNPSHFRKGFIGSVFKTEAKEVDVKSPLANSIIRKLGKEKKAREVRKYYLEMLQCFREMHRILKPRGKACIVIGDTQYKKIDILNHKVFIEQLSSMGFKIEKIILRDISSKMLPSARDSKNGKFAPSSSKNTKLVHPKEYIIIAEKQ